jgi:hypothetical protein
MNIIEDLMRDLHQRGIVVGPRGDRLAVDPVEKLEPAELEAIRDHEPEILSLFESRRFELVECPGSDCRELLFVIDGLTYCDAHGMSVRFSSDCRDFAVPIAQSAAAA